jgi:hypothetical protein
MADMTPPAQLFALDGDGGLRAGNLPQAKAGTPAAASKGLLAAVNWHATAILFFAAFFVYSDFMARICLKRMDAHFDLLRVNGLQQLHISTYQNRVTI